MSGHVRYTPTGDNEALRFNAMKATPQERALGVLYTHNPIPLMEGEEIWVRKGVVKRVRRKVQKKVEVGREWISKGYTPGSTVKNTIIQVEEENGELWVYGRTFFRGADGSTRYGAFHLPARSVPQEYEEEDSFDLHFVED